MQRNAWRQLWFMQGIPQWTAWSQHDYLWPPFISPCLVGVPDLWCFMTLWPVVPGNQMAPQGKSLFLIELTLQGLYESITINFLVISYDIKLHRSGSASHRVMMALSLTITTLSHHVGSPGTNFTEIGIKIQQNIVKMSFTNAVIQLIDIEWSVTKPILMTWILLTLFPIFRQVILRNLWCAYFFTTL